MKRTEIIISFKALVLFAILSAVFTQASYGDDDITLYDLQIKRYNGIVKDDFFKESNKPSSLNNQYTINRQKYKQLREANRKMLRLYDKEKATNEKIRTLLSEQIEEEFRLRFEFKKIQKEFEEHQASFMKNEMKALGNKISEYEKIKDESNKLAYKMNYNYSEYMEFQKEFKKQQEEFYQKQVEFYEKIEGNFNVQMKRYEDLRVNIDEEVR